MTQQETFDFVVGAIVAQGGPSCNDMGYCRYRTSDGRKCAAGHCIPDEVYNPEFEGCTAGPGHLAAASLASHPVARLRQAIADAGHDPDLVYQLQKAHDASTHDFGHRRTDEEFLVEFKLKATRVAALFGLNTGVAQ